CIPAVVTERPRSCSDVIQPDVAWRAALRPLAEPAIWMAPPNSSSFSVRVVLPAAGCEMIAKVRRRWVSRRWSGMAGPQPGPRAVWLKGPRLYAADLTL